MDFVAAQTISGAKPADLILDLSLLFLEPRERSVAFSKCSEVSGHQGAYRLAKFCRPNPCRPVDLVGNSDGNILHSSTLSQ
ncbi:hypothetical protein A4G28_26925 [Mycobacterium ostraviense]|uniref:Uncharacterized protein n=1 Tax=Mycobacterium ostraviense TaxID=2738409 RepID=A0A164EQ18_9MYCO|nr:hypothetical protein A4G28_26925 [Mycobacterium ostraviense]